jgi:hypothetical protein
VPSDEPRFVDDGLEGCDVVRRTGALVRQGATRWDHPAPTSATGALRLGGSTRTTKDIDIDWTLEADEATELLLDAAVTELDDWFVFDVRRGDDDDQWIGGGQRWIVRARQTVGVPLAEDDLGGNGELRSLTTSACASRSHRNRARASLARSACNL